MKVLYRVTEMREAGQTVKGGTHTLHRSHLMRRDAPLQVSPVSLYLDLEGITASCSTAVQKMMIGKSFVIRRVSPPVPLDSHNM
jgi:hypothetical protein